MSGDAVKEAAGREECQSPHAWDDGKTAREAGLPHSTISRVLDYSQSSWDAGWRTADLRLDEGSDLSGGMPDSTNPRDPTVEAILNPARARAAGERLGGQHGMTSKFSAFEWIRREADSAIIADGRLFQFASPEAQSAFWEGFWEGKNRRVEEDREAERLERICPVCDGRGLMDEPFHVRPRA